MNNKGFTLTEIMVTIVIVGILAAIAIPSYLGHVTRTRRAEAITALQTVVLYEEKARAESGNYVSESALIATYGLKPATGSEYTPTEYYTISITIPDDDHFTAYAEGTGTNADTVILAVDQSGTTGRATAVGDAVTQDDNLWKTLRK